MQDTEIGKEKTKVTAATLVASDAIMLELCYYCEIIVVITRSTQADSVVVVKCG